MKKPPCINCHRPYEGNHDLDMNEACIGVHPGSSYQYDTSVLLATAIIGQTLVGVDRSGPYPLKRGNCFSVDAHVYDPEFTEGLSIVNFGAENLEHLIASGLTWPVRVVRLSGHIAVIDDERIPDAFYWDQYCSVCCPTALMTEPQRMQLARQERRGEREVVKAEKFNMIRHHADKRPTLGLPPVSTEPLVFTAEVKCGATIANAGAVAKLSWRTQDVFLGGEGGDA